MVSVFLDVETAPWQTWSIPTAMVLSLGVGVMLGWFLALRRSSGQPGSPDRAGEDENLAAPETPLASGEEKEWEDKRGSPRHAVRPSRVLVAETPEEANAMEGVLLNRSLGGLGLSLEKELPTGRIFQVLLTADGQPSWIPLQVRYCRPERGRWTVGCKFVDPAPGAGLRRV
jgi:hypothetical protein